MSQRPLTLEFPYELDANINRAIWTKRTQPEEEVCSRQKISSETSRVLEVQKKEAVPNRKFEIRSQYEEFISEGMSDFEKKEKEDAMLFEKIPLLHVRLGSRNHCSRGSAARTDLREEGRNVT